MVIPCWTNFAYTSEYMTMIFYLLLIKSNSSLLQLYCELHVHMVRGTCIFHKHILFIFTEQCNFTDFHISISCTLVFYPWIENLTKAATWGLHTLVALELTYMVVRWRNVIGMLKWRHHVKLHHSVFQDFWKLRDFKIKTLDLVSKKKNPLFVWG